MEFVSLYLFESYKHKTPTELELKEIINILLKSHRDFLFIENINVCQ
jgi:hypothetical protein